MVRHTTERNIYTEKMYVKHKFVEQRQQQQLKGEFSAYILAAF
jgi:hypothetical protein